MNRAFRKAEQGTVSDIKKTYLYYFNKYKNNKSKMLRLAALLYNRASKLRETKDKRKTTLYDNLFLKCNDYYITTFTKDLDDYYDLF